MVTISIKGPWRCKPWRTAVCQWVGRASPRRPQLQGQRRRCRITPPRLQRQLRLHKIRQLTWVGSLLYRRKNLLFTLTLCANATEKKSTIVKTELSPMTLKSLDDYKRPKKKLAHFSWSSPRPINFISVSDFILANLILQINQTLSHGEEQKKDILFVYSVWMIFVCIYVQVEV